MAASPQVWCLLVGKGFTKFCVEIAASKKAVDLQQAIASMETLLGQPCHPSQMHLLLAKTADGRWLSSLSPLAKLLGAEGHWSIEQVSKALGGEAWELDPEHTLGGLLTSTGEMQIHVLVVVTENRNKRPGGKPEKRWAKRMKMAAPAPAQYPASAWFPDAMAQTEVTTYKAHKGAYNYELVRKATYVEMAGFPPLVDKVTGHSRILERRSYRVMFDGLVNETAKHLGRKSTHLEVVGNPGIGQSRFYLYCAFRLIRDLLSDGASLPDYTLVLNCHDSFLRYSWRSKAFYDVDIEGMKKLMALDNVIRLIDGASSRLAGWGGVSILFTSPEETRYLSEYRELSPFRYIAPVWDLDELVTSNALLGEGVKLSEEELKARFATYGGVPRQLYAADRDELELTLTTAIDAVSAFDIGRVSSYDDPVWEQTYTHLVIAMVPTKPDYRTHFKMEYLSKEIADRVNKARSEK